MIRVVRRWARRFGPPLTVWYHPNFRLPVPPVHLVPGMSPRRAVDALTWAVDQAVVAPPEVHEALEISWHDLSRVHVPAYLERLDEPEVVAEILGVSPDVVSVQRVVEYWRRAAGATVQAARWVLLNGGRAVNLSGGFHHAAADRGAGFCAFNDVAVAVKTVRALGLTGHIVVVDLDAHPPDGIVDLLGDDRDVTVVSLGTESEWTLRRGVQATVHDQRLPVGTGSAAYLTAVDGVLQRVPTGAVLAFYVAGADPLSGDPLGELDVDRDALRQRDRAVFRALGSVPTVTVAGGGYDDASWQVLAGTIAEAAGLRVRVHSGYDPVYRRALDVSRALDPWDLSGVDDALISEEELLQSLGAPGRRTEPRFLGFYTRHGLERALESYDFLDALRQLGFDDLRVQVQSHSGADRMFVTAQVDGRAEVVMDLSATIRTADGWRTLFVEWLELRDPRTTFTSSRPKLPGQNAPGLGLAEETGQLLARAADRLGLDGVSFVAAHYHVAWIARGRFMVRDPVKRGWLLALIEHLEDVPLLEASRRLATDGLPTEDGEPVRWRPTEMVIPIRPEFVAWLEQGSAIAEESAASLSSRLLPVAS